ncbi:MAG: hypothetical protein QXI12_05510 [Candidatus Methanomethyliaceae archaeon]
MAQPPALTPGQLVVLCGGTALTAAAHRLVVALLERGPVHLLDAGVRLHPYLLTRLIRQHTVEVEARLTRLHLQRAFTAHQVAAALEALPATAVPLVVLDLLAPFYDDTLPLPQAQVLLQRSLTQCERLQQGSPLLITLTPPPHPTRRPLLDAVCRRATTIFLDPEPTPLPTQLSFW